MGDHLEVDNVVTLHWHYQLYPYHINNVYAYQEIENNLLGKEGYSHSNLITINNV